MMDGCQRSLVKRGLSQVVIVRQGEVSVVRGLSDLREAVVDRIPRVRICHLDILIIHRVSSSATGSFV